jgi:predicted alpha-1,2-mannosidase
MTVRLLILASLCAGLFLSSPRANAGPADLRVRYVNPLIGTAPSVTPGSLAHGTGTENSAQVVPEVTVPFGMTNWTPQTRHVETKCVAPYYYTDTLISGFRGSHWLSGSCTQDYGSVTIMPTTGVLRCLPEARASRFSHARETATPYYYRVALDDYAIENEITATSRCGLCRFTFGTADTASFVIEPNSDEGEGFVRIVPERGEIEGYNPVHRIYQGWGEPAGFRGYFVIRFTSPFGIYGTYQGNNVQPGTTEAGGQKSTGAFVRFVTGGRTRYVVRIGTSFTSIEGARRNLDAEAGTLDFDTAVERLREQWERNLSRVSVEGGTEPAKTKLYTALYHALLVPRVYNDCDGAYPSFAGGDSICNAGTSSYYCDFSLWDTYRSLHPLFNLLLPDVNAAMVRSLLTKARQGGWLPIFPCWNSYTSAMIGDHAIAVIADAFVKGAVTLSDEDYAYLRKNATELPSDRRDYLNGKGVRALDSYMRYGYVPLDDSVKESFHKGEQVSRTLEYAYDDYALSQIAKKMGKMSDARMFHARSQNYRNVFNPALRCVCGRFADGRFTSEFLKTARMPYITEGTPWQYTWYVPHDVSGLISLMGGVDEFESNLDEFFASGQYWHGNEPDQQVPFLFAFTRHPWKASGIVKNIMRDEYSDTPGGLSGNDDAGQMSAWYIFAALGIYPVCPSQDEYVLTSPAFDRITLQLPHGKNLVIRAAGVSEGKAYVRSVDFNGKPIRGWQLQHSRLMRGGTLTFAMQHDRPRE